MSDTAQANRPLILRGRIGPLSLQAQIRMVCGDLFRWYAASPVGIAALVSCSSGVGWMVRAAIFESPSTNQLGCMKTHSFHC